MMFNAGQYVNRRGRSIGRVLLELEHDPVKLLLFLDAFHGLNGLFATFENGRELLLFFRQLVAKGGAVTMPLEARARYN